MQVQRYSDTPMYESFLKDCVSTIAISNAHDVSTSAPTFIQISRQAAMAERIQRICVIIKLHDILSQSLHLHSIKPTTEARKV